MNSLFFSYDGILSQDMGVYLVKINTGMQTTPYLPSREIVSENVFGKDDPFVYGMNHSPLTLTLVLASMENNFWTFEKRREIARWLSCNKFAEFYVADEEFIDRRFFLMYEGGVDLTTNSNQEGYIEITFRNISPYTYSPVLQQVYDFSTNTTTSDFTFTSLGDLDLYPQRLLIKKINNGNISFYNNSDGGRLFQFTSLIDGEIVTVDNESRTIETSLLSTNRYSNFNGNYLRFKYGNNFMQISGQCQIELYYRYTFKG
jgi:phage-related protein